jgi:hypothetical protein
MIVGNWRPRGILLEGYRYRLGAFSILMGFSSIGSITEGSPPW